MMIKNDDDWYARKRNAVAGGWTVKPVLYFIISTALARTPQGETAVMAQIIPVVKEDGKLTIWPGADIVDKRDDA